MIDAEHHWVFRYCDDTKVLIEASPLIVDEAGHVVGLMNGLTLLTDLDGLRKRAWTISEVDDMEEPTDVQLVWAAEGHGTNPPVTGRTTS